jgi:hypothetical protein
VNACRFLAFAVCLIAASLALANAPIPAADELPPLAKAETPKDVQSATQAAPDKLRGYKIRGNCVDHADNSPAAGVRVLLFEAPGRTLPIGQIGETTSDAKGEFEFPNLNPPRDVDGLDRLEYRVVIVDPNWAIAIETIGFRPAKPAEIRLSREQETLSGQVVNARGQPVASAIAAILSVDDRVLPGILSTTTGSDGRFMIDKLPVIRRRDGSRMPVLFQVLHRDYPTTNVRLDELPADLKFELPDGCTVTGRVIDADTGKPAANALVWSQNLKFGWQEAFASSDAAGKFRMVLREGRYHFLAEASDRISVPLIDLDCIAGETLELPPLTLIAGGLICGKVLNSSTHQPVLRSKNGNPIILGLFGPSHPPTPRRLVPARLTSVDAEGRFSLRAAPGENFPYLLDIDCDRMPSDTQLQPPVIVKEGQTTAYDMLVPPERTPAEKLEAARALVAALPKEPSARTARLMEEFDKHEQVDRMRNPYEEPERWCALMRELVAIGPTAVPQICEELDRTQQERVLQRLCFALRAIGDPRAVPALIRAVPKTLSRRTGPTVMHVKDRELGTFLRQNCVKGMRLIGLDPPVREVFAALHKLTGQDFDDDEVERLILAEGRLSQILQRRIYFRQARLWQAWWEANWNKFTSDPAYEKVHLASADEPVPPSAKTLSKTARLIFGRTAFLSPLREKGRHVTSYVDLDTGYEPKWPADFPRDESRVDRKQLSKWALENGVDLMCVTRRAPDGTKAYVLEAFNMQVWEITPRDVRYFNRSLAAGTLPNGRAIADRANTGRAIADKANTGRGAAATPNTGGEAGDLLMHYDAKSGHPVPGASAVFLFKTHEGNIGLIEVPDQVAKAATLPAAGRRPKELGFLIFTIRLIID